MAAFLEVRDLVKVHPARGIIARHRGGLRAVDRVSFSIDQQTVFGLVGESGCGKTTLARALLYLDPPSSGEVRLEGTLLGGLRPPELRRLRRRMQIVFQDPNSALDPRMSIRGSLSEGLANRGLGPAERRRRAEELLELVGLQPKHAGRRPHEFSGGQKQRIVVARALSMEPRFLVLDEPVSNLDVSIQAQIINLLLRLKERLRLTYLFISHDLNLVAYLADRIAVMFRGRIVELSRTEELLTHPLHPYTLELFSAVPRLVGGGAAGARVEEPLARGPGAEDRREQERRTERPAAEARPGLGCPYYPRCARGEPACAEMDPELTDSGGGHLVACHKLQLSGGIA
jgi:oligopeptide transport system ATP-binding protein